MADEPRRTDDRVIPLVEERLRIDKEETITGRVRVRTVVREEQVEVDEPIVATDAHVERVSVERWVEAMVPDRREGDTVVVSLHREVVTVERRLQVYEELHITPRRHEERVRDTVTVRHEDAVIERIEPTTAD